MKDQNLPRVLSISLSAWRKDSGIHTQTDLFKYWNPQKVAQIYLKADLPDTPVCSRFFQISENAIIKSVFNRKPVGREVTNGEAQNENDLKATNEEKRLYDIAHKKKSWFFTLIREIVWACAKWKTVALDNFIKDFDADVYFIPIYPVAYAGWLQWYIIKKFPKPYVCYLADDNYSYQSCGRNLWSWIHRWLLRKIVKKLATNCTEMFTITKTEGLETDRDFGTHSIVLTKGIDYSKLTFNERTPNFPIKMVYTGNLLIGRASSLVAISKALQEINKDGIKMTLDIYTPTELDKHTTLLLNSNGCVKHPPVPKEKVAKIQNDADIVVFVESLEKEHKFDARLSFSTKLTDYFASGKCIFAIGDKSIAPIQYLEEYDCAITCSDYDLVEEELRMLINNPTKITEYGKKAFNTGKMNHEESKVKSTFIETLCKAVLFKQK